MDVYWARVTNVTGISTSNRIEKTTGAATTYNAGAESIQILASGNIDLEMTVVETNKRRAFGLNPYSASGVTDVAQQTIAVELGSGATYTVTQSGSSVTTAAAYSASDVFKISIDTGVFKVYKNGSLVWTSALTVTYPYRASAAFYDLNATISTATLTGAGVDANLYFDDGREAVVATRFCLPPLFGGVHSAPFGSETGQNYPRGGNRQSR